MGISNALKAATKATEDVLQRFLPPWLPGRTEIAAASGYVEYGGSPVGVLTPDFIGQVCQDTTTGVFYSAQGTTSSDWTATGSKLLPSMFVGVSSASVAGDEIFNVTRVDANAGALTRPLMSLFEHAVAPAVAPGVTTDFHCIDARVYGSSANINSTTRFYCIEGKATCQKASGSMARTVGVMGSSVMTGAGTVDLAVGMQTDVQNTGAGTVTEGVGIYIPNAVNSGGGTLTTSYGIKIENQTAGSTNYSIYTSQGRVRFFGGTAIPAGGTAGVGVAFSSTSNFGVFFGSGAPSLAAAKGSLYLRSDGSTTNDRAYINTNGGSTWTALTTVA